MAKNPHRVQPIERFPAKPRADGRFQKKIRRRFYYFGSGNGDREAALAEYDRVKERLYAGQPVLPPMPKNGLQASPFRDIVIRYLADRKSILSPSTYSKYRRALRDAVRFFGKPAPWQSIAIDDWTRYGAKLRRKSPYTYNVERAAIMACFNHAAAQDWIDRAPKLGRGFARAPLSKLRAVRRKRLLSSEDLNAMLGYARPQVFAMILLGVNGGMGPADCAALTWENIDLDAGVIRDRRAKNRIPRTVPLWPETVTALRRVRRKRPMDDLVFRTKRGLAWSNTSVAHEMKNFMKLSGVVMPDGVGFYALRHTFATYANEVRDTDARRAIMGRVVPNLDDVYVETFFIDRLKAVTDHVRAKLSIAQIIGDAFHDG